MVGHPLVCYMPASKSRRHICAYFNNILPWVPA